MGEDESDMHVCMRKGIYGPLQAAFGVEIHTKPLSEDSQRFVSVAQRRQADWDLDRLSDPPFEWFSFKSEYDRIRSMGWVSVRIKHGL